MHPDTSRDLRTGIGTNTVLNGDQSCSLDSVSFGQSCAITGKTQIIEEHLPVYGHVSFVC